MNVVEDSLSVNVIVAVWPALSVLVELKRAIVGGIVSIVTSSTLLAVLVFPVASLNTPAGTETVPIPAYAMAGVKIAVYPAPEPLNAESVPPVATTSASVKSVEDSLSVNVIVAAAPPFSAAKVELIVMPGASVSLVKVSPAPSGPVAFRSVSLAVSVFTPSTPRSAPVTVKST